MEEEIYRCNNCGYEDKFPKGCIVWCPCKPRVKSKMEKYKPEQQKIMKKEFKLNLEYVTW